MFSGYSKLVRNAIKNKFNYNVQGMAFHGEGSWSFDNDLARNILIFRADNSSSSHTDNRKNKLSLLCQGPTVTIVLSEGLVVIYIIRWYNFNNLGSV